MLSFILMLLLTTKLINKFNYYITTHFITSNKDYNSYCNPYSVYQTYPKVDRSFYSTNTLLSDKLLLVLIWAYNLHNFFTN